MPQRQMPCKSNPSHEILSRLNHLRAPPRTTLGLLRLIKRISKFLCTSSVLVSLSLNRLLTQAKVLVLDLRHSPLVVLHRLLILPRGPRLTVRLCALGEATATTWP